MKAIFFLEAGPKVGFGHFSRCVSLAFALLERNFELSFVISGEKGSIGEKYPFLIEFIDWVTAPEYLKKYIIKNDCAIFDSYHITENHMKLINKSSCYPIFIDDLNSLEYSKGIVINSAFSASALGYQNKPGVIYLLGPKYMMLKKEFWGRIDRIINKNIQNILITWGGSDHRNLTPKIIKKLQEINPNWNIHVIVTQYFHNVTEINEAISSKCKIIQNPNTREIIELMLNSDCALTAGGQTCFELLCMGVPSIVVATAKNQLFNAEIMGKMGVILYAGEWKSHKLLSTIQLKLQKFQNYEIRRKAVEIGRRHINPEGSRVIAEIIYRMTKK